MPDDWEPIAATFGMTRLSYQCGAFILRNGQYPDFTRLWNNVNSANYHPLSPVRHIKMRALIRAKQDASSLMNRLQDDGKYHTYALKRCHFVNGNLFSTTPFILRRMVMPQRRYVSFSSTKPTSWRHRAWHRQRRVALLASIVSRRVHDITGLIREHWGISRRRCEIDGYFRIWLLRKLYALSRGREYL